MAGEDLSLMRISCLMSREFRHGKRRSPRQYTMRAEEEEDGGSKNSVPQKYRDMLQKSSSRKVGKRRHCASNQAQGSWSSRSEQRRIVALWDRCGVKGEGGRRRTKAPSKRPRGGSIRTGRWFLSAIGTTSGLPWTI